MRDILVYADRLDVWSGAVQYAAQLAAGLRASLTAAFVYPLPQHMMPAYGASALLTAIIEHNRRIEEEARAAERRFVEWAATCGVLHASWRVIEGFAPEVLARIANWHDVLVLENDGEREWASAGDLGSLVLRVDLPCLIVPRKAPASVKRDCVALAWNGAVEGLRAIHAAMPLIENAKRVVLLSGRQRDSMSDLGWSPSFDISAYLRRHGIGVEHRAIGADDKDAGAALLSAATQVGADLLVMGAYGRNRFSEWIFGGATRHVLAHAQVPVFMRH